MKCNNNWDCPAGSFPYIVKSGDTLYSLAKKYESTVERLAEINNIKNPDCILAGHKLCIPLPIQYYPNCRTTNYYIVRGGDSALSISRYFGISTTQLLYSNIGIDIDNLYDGMVLCIPLAPPLMCIEVKDCCLKLDYFSGEELSFPCASIAHGISGDIVTKQLDSSNGGFKRLNILEDVAITNAGGKRSDRDIVLSDDAMEKIFNLVTVGTEVNII